MTITITPDERAEWRSLADAATEGPWEADGSEVSQHWSRPEPWLTVASSEVACMSYCYGGSARGIERDEDAAFIAAARTAVPRLLDALDTAEAEAARLRATVSPAWDEDTVRAEAKDAITEMEFDYDFESGHLPDEDAYTGAVLAVVRRHLPVRPDRETIVRAMHAEVCCPCDPTGCDVAEVSENRYADAVLALWPGESRATVQAEALREAAVTARRCWTRSTNLLDEEDPEVAYSFDRWLEVRADRIEKGEAR